MVDDGRDGTNGVVFVRGWNGEAAGVLRCLLTCGVARRDVSRDRRGRRGGEGVATLFRDVRGRLVSAAASSSGSGLRILVLLSLIHI